MKYIAKPRMSNSLGMKEFDNQLDAVLYLNSVLSAKDSDGERFDYTYVVPSASPKNLRRTVEEYVWIGKLIVV
jgi:hypothetical protein